MSRIQYALLLIVFALPLLGASCVRQDSVKAEKKERPGPSAQLRGLLKKGQEQAVQVIRRGSENLLKSLSDEQKKAIDEWLARNKLNQYGDVPDTVYSGGTPLFNERTGQTIDRFEYLFKKFPQLKEIIKNTGAEQAN